MGDLDAFARRNDAAGHCFVLTGMRAGCSMQTFKLCLSIILSLYLFLRELCSLLLSSHTSRSMCGLCFFLYSFFGFIPSATPLSAPRSPTPTSSTLVWFLFRCDVHMVIARLKYSKMTVSVSISQPSLLKYLVLHILLCLPFIIQAPESQNPRIQNRPVRHRQRLP